MHELGVDVIFLKIKLKLLLGMAMLRDRLSKFYVLLNWVGELWCSPRGVTECPLVTTVPLCFHHVIVRGLWLVIPNSLPGLTINWIGSRHFLVPLLGRACKQATFLFPADRQFELLICWVQLRSLFHWPWKSPEGSSQLSTHTFIRTRLKKRRFSWHPGLLSYQNELFLRPQLSEGT